ncbi:hypothetical protein PMAYCL1PPCAC_16347 [Pristionchus mayeri]|uniref:G protein-coupled receptor n=1 Tax=Pristionchus mayeri TaxID=1317129 RepID=A0AAN5HZ51_9BILA|nr:hypothetical protein PMAYCL1PPCAC_16347 [Pristionchus mayeri]
MLIEKRRIMSAKTLGLHRSFTNMLTLDVAVSVFFGILVLPLVCLQIFGKIHSPDLEGLAYDVTVLPAVIHPALTLYFVPSYRKIIRSFAHRKSTVSNMHHSGIFMPKMPSPSERRNSVLIL